MHVAGKCFARVIMIGVLIEAIISGRAKNVKEIAVASFAFRLLTMSIVFGVLCLQKRTYVVYMINQIIIILVDAG